MITNDNEIRLALLQNDGTSQLCKFIEDTGDFKKVKRIALAILNSDNSLTVKDNLTKTKEYYKKNKDIIRRNLSIKLIFDKDISPKTMQLSKIDFAAIRSYFITHFDAFANEEEKVLNEYLNRLSLIQLESPEIQHVNRMMKGISEIKKRPADFLKFGLHLLAPNCNSEELCKIVKLLGAQEGMCSQISSYFPLEIIKNSEILWALIKTLVELNPSAFLSMWIRHKPFVKLSWSEKLIFLLIHRDVDCESLINSELMKIVLEQCASGEQRQLFKRRILQECLKNGVEGLEKRFEWFEVANGEEKYGIALKLAENPLNQMSANIDRFQLTKEQRFEVAKTRCKYSNDLFKHVKNYALGEEELEELHLLAGHEIETYFQSRNISLSPEDEAKRLEIALKAFQHRASLMKPTDIQTKYHVHLPNNVLKLFSTLFKEDPHNRYLFFNQIGVEDFDRLKSLILEDSSQSALIALLKKLIRENTSEKIAESFEKMLHHIQEDLARNKLTGARKKFSQREIFKWFGDTVCCLVASPDAKKSLEDLSNKEKLYPLLLQLYNYRNPAHRIFLTLELFKILLKGELYQEWIKFLYQNAEFKSDLRNTALLPSILLMAAGNTKPFDLALEQIARRMLFRDKLNLNILLKFLGKLGNPFLSSDIKEKLLTVLFNPVGWEHERPLVAMSIASDWISTDQAENLEKINSRRDFFSGFEKQLKLLLPELKVANLAEKFNQTFNTFRNPEAILNLAAGFQNLIEPNKTEALRLLTIFVTAVLEEKYQESRYDRMANPHLETIFSAYPQLESLWKAGTDPILKEDGEIIVQDSDDPCDLLLQGTETPSCHHVTFTPELSKYILGSLLNGHIRIVTVKDLSGAMVGRALLKLLWDPVAKRPVLLQEATYFAAKGFTFDPRSYISEMCEQRASALGLPLLVEENSSLSSYPNPVVSLGGRSDFEDCDTLDHKGSSRYVIPKASIRYPK